MAFTIDGDDPIEDVLAEVQRVYGVQVEVVAQEPRRGGGGKDPDIGSRTKQDRT